MTPNVLTGTNPDGTASGLACSDWSTTADTATAGGSSFSDNRWTALGTLDCSAWARVYCFEQ